MLPAIVIAELCMWKMNTSDDPSRHSWFTFPFIILDPILAAVPRATAAVD